MDLEKVIDLYDLYKLSPPKLYLYLLYMYYGVSRVFISAEEIEARFLVESFSQCGGVGVYTWVWFGVFWCWSFPYEMGDFLGSARVWWLFLLSSLRKVEAMVSCWPNLITFFTDVPPRRFPLLLLRS